ncbi:NAD(P)H-dependent oxidoreductase [Pseudonocardia sp. C8]|uniref:NAD(P)H-dependent oxidoreductase n=1 Tax=Pseudonocardia sp. C8 TaxID=2762759 RepID=UPI0016429097|nr:NAD(P)H-dependent oxidoreductase [Pseudonocardia sp. C8]MBC3190315.1 NAD(P)H-dependent oxidoreductase [Pseudonocardia sp. C8]
MTLVVGPALLAIVGSPTAGGRTVTAAQAVLRGAEAEGARVRTLELAAAPDPEFVQNEMEAADGILFASPTYRARSTGLIKNLLEDTQRGARGESRSPLRGKATALVHTGASAHHFLAVDDLRSVLAGFFAAQVLSPGLYFETADYSGTTQLTDDAAGLAAAHGRAFAHFTHAIRTAPAITSLRPLI